MKLIDIEQYRDDPRLTREWPPVFVPEYERRVKLLTTMRADPQLLTALKVHYAENPIDFILDMITSFDPRNAGTELPTTFPFKLFFRQVEIVAMLHECVIHKESALIKKVRDCGATVCACAYAVWMWTFMDGANVILGSRKEMLVDRLGDPGSIFEKVRAMIRLLPPEFQPDGFDEKQHFNYMKIVNPVNGSTITGEAGDNIGRGSRARLVVLDEHAFLDRAENVEAAVGDAADARLDISTVNGMNMFYRRYQAGKEWTQGHDIPKGTIRRMTFSWFDHPAKTQEWYDRRRASAEAAGILHKFAAEVDGDFAASVTGVVIPSKWVQACIDAHKVLGWPEPTGKRIAAMDVADTDSGDPSAMTVKRGYLVESNITDTGESDKVARQWYMLADMIGCREWRYESTGVGAGARSGASSYQRAALDKGRDLATLPHLINWSPSGAVVKPNCDVSTGLPVEPGDKESIRNKDFYVNIRSQAWWKLRTLCHNTYKARYEGADVDPDECLSFSSDMEGLQELLVEISQPTYMVNDNTGKILIDKNPDGVSSPNRADSLMIAVSPLRPDVDETMHVGGMGADSIEYVAVG